MSWYGDCDVNARIDFLFTSIDATGLPTAITTGSACVRRAGQNTLAHAGVVMTTSGAQNFITVFTGSASSYFINGANYDVFWGNGTVGSISIVGYPIGSFSIRNRSGLQPTTAGNTLDVSAAGNAGIDWSNIEAPTTAQGLTGTTIGVSQVVASVSGSVGSVTGAVGSVTGAVGSVTGNVGGNVVGTVGSVVGAVGSVAAGGIAAAAFAAGAVNAAALAADAANEIADALLDRADAIEVGLTPRQAMRLSGSAEAGLLSGAGTGTITIRNAVADSKNRIVATVDAAGNRSAIVTDVT